MTRFGVGFLFGCFTAIYAVAWWESRFPAFEGSVDELIEVISTTGGRREHRSWPLT